MFAMTLRTKELTTHSKLEKIYYKRNALSKMCSFTTRTGIEWIEKSIIQYPSWAGLYIIILTAWISLSLTQTNYTLT